MATGSPRRGPGRRLARRVVEAARVGAPTWHRFGIRRRRARFIRRLKLAALWQHATVDVDIARDVDIAAGVRVDFVPWSANRVVIGSGARVGDHVRLSLRGGSLTVGPETDIRRLGTYQVSGDLRIGSGCVLSTGITVHCAQSVAIDDLTIIGEFATVADSAHRRTPPGVPVHHNVRTAPVHVGRNVWVGAHAVVASGVRIGDQCFIGAASVVTKDVPAGWLAAGVPARAVREIEVDDSAR